MGALSLARARPVAPRPSVISEVPIVRRWAALGDSLTAGHRAGEQTWVTDVRSRLSAAGRVPEVHNLAAAGALTAEVAGHQAPVARALKPDLVTVFCGGNDVLLRVRPDIRAFADAYDAMAGGLRSELPDARILVVTYPELARMLPLRERARERVARGLIAVNAVIRGVARRRRLTLLDFARIVEHGDHSIFDDDGVHPSAAGRRIAADAFADAIETLLASEQGGT